MNGRVGRLVPLALLALLGGGCATTAEWTAWRDHPTHFASDDHLSFSIRDPDSAEPRVTRHDLTVARQEAWWGDPVTVPQDRILQR
jgi:hypothetical protein